MAFAVDDGPVQLWRRAIRCRRNFSKLRQIRPGCSAHNDAFETAIEQHVLHARHGWPIIPLERHRCTMAMCLALGLPARLSAAADALELAKPQRRCRRTADASDVEAAARAPGRRSGGHILV